MLGASMPSSTRPSPALVMTKRPSDQTPPALQTIDHLHNLYSVLLQGPLQRAEQMQSVAIECPSGLSYRFEDLHRASGRIANWLRSLGLAQGDRVAAQVEKSPEAVMLYLATIRAGFVFLPLNTAYRAGEIGYFLEDATPAVVICSPENREWIAPLARRSGCRVLETLGETRDGSLLQAAAGFADDSPIAPTAPDALAAILYTSGTTGRSKGAMLTHRNLASNAMVLHRVWHWQSGDVLLHALPIFHVHGLFVALHGALLNASKIIWLSRFDLDAVIGALPGATLMMGVPTFYVRLLGESRFNRQLVEHMRLFISGSAPMLAETHLAFTERTGHRILERYGMSETIMLTSNPYEGDRRAGTVGHPLPETELRLVCAQTSQIIRRPVSGEASEIGGVEVRGPNVFIGYWNMPQKTQEEFTPDGWFKTGDVGQWDGSGYLALVGRSKDLIITGGYNVYPKEVEGLLDEWPGVAESAVFGVPHPDFGEAVMAVVVARPGIDLEVEAIRASLRESIANYKVPKQIHLLDSLPRNVMGKVQKNLLRERFGPASRGAVA